MSNDGYTCPACHWTHLARGAWCDSCGAAMDDTPPVADSCFVGPLGDSPRGVARHPQSQRFHDLLDEMKRLHDAKQGDYGRDDAPFANCQASEDFDVAPWIGTMIRANDKMRRIQRYAQRGTLSHEGVRDSFLDLAVYVAIACLLWEDSQAT